jgi:hypothetical protein
MRSSDDGLTWSRPSRTVVGVDPELVLMSNGVLACSYGRVMPREQRGNITGAENPNAYFSVGNRIMFSIDRGRTWGDPVSLYEGPSTGYTGIEEVSPGELLFVHDVAGKVQGGGVNKIKAIDIHVTAT